MIKEFETFLTNIENEENYNFTSEIMVWIPKRFPNLDEKFAWNQPMYTDHGTFILGLSVSKKHLAVGFEDGIIETFLDEIKESGFEYGKKIIRFPWNKTVDYKLLERMIQFTIDDKINVETFWKK